ncbi:MAG: hypothetical protein E2598_10465 [Sphingobium sp.]|nr:hypothetical protein [Sphingobium sp.]
MQEAIEQAIIRKSKAVLRDQQIAAATKRKHADRYEKRTGLAAGTPAVQEPRWWSFHPHFDPRYCISHARFLSKTIWRKLQANEYSPVPAVQFDVPKPDGSTREIMAFAIPDSAVANVFHRSITRRNLNIFSSYSFAYRTDKSVFDAILHLKRSLKHPKSYLIQYDFAKYFDSIDHDYLRKIVSNRDLFILTSAERSAILSFLEHRFCHVNSYQASSFSERSRGVPQGCSLSLFLSNAAAHELDLALERQNGTFVRFADDVVAIAHSYSDARDIAQQFRSHCKIAGTSINYSKSPGIQLFDNGIERDQRSFFLDSDDGGEIETIGSFDYLGHNIRSSGISLSSKAVKRIKRRISEVLYKHLLLYRRDVGSSVNAGRVGIGFYDWDLVTCLNEMRRYLYGGLREDQVIEFIDGNAVLPFVKGLMAFYPLVTDPKPLVELDGWLESVIRRALRERVRILAAHGIAQPTLSKSDLRSGSWYNYPEINNDTRMPSFVRGWRAARKYYLRYGLRNIDPPSYYSLLSLY